MFFQDPNSIKVTGLSASYSSTDYRSSVFWSGCPHTVLVPSKTHRDFTGQSYISPTASYLPFTLRPCIYCTTIIYQSHRFVPVFTVLQSKSRHATYALSRLYLESLNLIQEASLDYLNFVQAKIKSLFRHARKCVRVSDSARGKKIFLKKNSVLN